MTDHKSGPVIHTTAPSEDAPFDMVVFLDDNANAWTETLDPDTGEWDQASGIENLREAHRRLTATLSRLGAMLTVADPEPEPLLTPCEGSKAEPVSGICPMCGIQSSAVGGGTLMPQHNRRDPDADLQNIESRLPHVESGAAYDELYFGETAPTFTSESVDVRVDRLERLAAHSQLSVPYRPGGVNELQAQVAADQEYLKAKPAPGRAAQLTDISQPPRGYGWLIDDLLLVKEHADSSTHVTINAAVQAIRDLEALLP